MTLERHPSFLQGAGRLRPAPFFRFPPKGVPSGDPVVPSRGKLKQKTTNMRFLHTLDSRKVQELVRENNTPASGGSSMKLYHLYLYHLEHTVEERHDCPYGWRGSGVWDEDFFRLGYSKWTIAAGTLHEAFEVYKEEKERRYAECIESLRADRPGNPECFLRSLASSRLGDDYYESEILGIVQAGYAPAEEVCPAVLDDETRMPEEWLDKDDSEGCISEALKVFGDHKTIDLSSPGARIDLAVSRLLTAEGDTVTDTYVEKSLDEVRALLPASVTWTSAGKDLTRISENGKNIIQVKTVVKNENKYSRWVEIEEAGSSR